MSVELRTIYLHGALGRRFGRCFRLAVATPAEAVRALSLQLDGFRAALREGLYRVVAGAPGRRRERGEDEMTVGFSHALHIVPVIAGAGGRGGAVGLVVAGAALLTAAFAAPLLLGGGLLGSATIFGVSTQTIGLVGASLALSGVSALLAPKPKLEGGTTSPTDERFESFMFGGLPDRPIAGRPVPVNVGLFRVTCIRVSVQLKNVRLA